jgi:transcription antitermination protein NusB
MEQSPTTTPAKNRRKARELALQSLYAFEMSTEKNFSTIFNNIANNEEFGAYTAEIRSYALFLGSKVVESKDETDVLLQRHTANWDIHRMNAIDRTILRLAVGELRFSPDVPYKVIIDEAVELAKQYGTQESGKFVNGIIDAVYKEELHGTRE